MAQVKLQGLPYWLLRLYLGYIQALLKALLSDIKPSYYFLTCIPQPQHRLHIPTSDDGCDRN
jgi:hypothetical protein